MKASRCKILSITALVTAIFAIICSFVTARHQARLIAPISYHFHRLYHDPFDIVSEMIRTPIYFNTMLSQQNAVHTPLVRSTPRYTVSEENGIVQLEMEVPGVLPNDIVIDLEDNSHLHIKGKRSNKNIGTAGSVEESEFDIVFRLNDNVDPAQLKASLSAGILRVQVPNKEKEVKRIKIDENDGTEKDEIISLTVNTKENETVSSTAASEATEEVVDGITISEMD